MGAVVFFYAMGEYWISAFLPERHMLTGYAVVLQIRAYVVCDARRPLLCTFFILDGLAAVMFILELTVVQSMPVSHLSMPANL